ncbi:MAG: hypothetical protein GY793_09385 [Proteobacteria bacterium]|nr:hypothetical protein [Pseudomonadota bacterium]
MENLNNIIIQKLTIFGLVILFIIAQTFFPMKGIGLFLVLPSIFMLLTYKPDSMKYGSCFMLGLINDIFCMQLLGLSSIVFISLRFCKILSGNASSKSYWLILKEYLFYAYILLIVIYSFTLIIQIHEFNIMNMVSISLMQFFGFFVCYYLWSRIFELLDK